LVAGLVAGLLLGITKPTMKGWLIGLVIGLLLCVTVGLLVDFSNYPSLNPFYSRDRFFLALTLATIFGIGGGIIGCVIGAIADLIFFALVPDQ
jgi:hypothetical protein